MYRKQGIGNTIIRKEIRQHESSNIRQQISTYLIPIRKDYFPIDTRFFTASKIDKAIFIKCPDNILVIRAFTVLSYLREYNI